MFPYFICLLIGLVLQVSTPQSPTSVTAPSILVPAMIALFVLLVTNVILFIKIRVDARTTLKRELTLQEITKLKERLKQFYDPLVALTAINAAMITKLGRKTFPEDPHLRSEAVAVWNATIQNVVLPTNRKMCDIIREYSHLIDPADNFENYMNFIVHAESYQIFSTKRNQIHHNFQYPEGFDTDLRAVRNRVIQQLEAVENDIGSYLMKRRY